MIPLHHTKATIFSCIRRFLPQPLKDLSNWRALLTDVVKLTNDSVAGLHKHSQEGTINHHYYIWIRNYHSVTVTLTATSIVTALFAA
jgi:hypothetical protein